MPLLANFITGLFFLSYPSLNSRSEIFDENAFLQQDLSGILLPQTEFYGYIGAEKQRIYVVFDSIWKSKESPLLYNVKGHSIVRQNRCDFKGSLLIEAIELDSIGPKRLDQEYEGLKPELSGKIRGSYYFPENPEQIHVGLFQGVFWSSWFGGFNSGFESNRIEKYSADYRNNQYQGTWRAYGGDKLKPCCWGEYRIPNCGDLDMGAAEFSPNPKYRAQGW